MQIGIIGLGYVGLPLAVAFAEAGCEVTGLDVDEAKVEALNTGRSYIEDVPDTVLAPVAEKLRATTDYAELAACDAVILCVPTPLSDSREPDLGPLEASARALAQVLRSGQLVVL
ncbi:MAG TPA: 2-dehydropantoate 2-reductase N-terminal domain-containing protein, partial [Solirubrobacterales bacterium]|nr:2-dehydropantoate 2-reductase N-terminal domain-containing protein [Solirubrobacterales bacterium]